MPAPYVKSLVGKLGKSKKELEELWEKAKRVVLKQFPKLKKGSDRYYAAVMGVFKRISGASSLSESNVDYDSMICVYECRERLRKRK